MKQAFIILLLASMVSTTANAQMILGAKAGYDYNTDKGVLASSSTVKDIAKGNGNKAGYHFGAFLNVDLPIGSLYLQPELLYTHISNSYETVSGGTTQNLEVNINRLDIPVLGGVKLLGFARAYAGLVFSYNMSHKVRLAELSSTKLGKGATGIQAGLGIDLGKICVDARFEGPLTKSVLRVIDKSNDTFEIESKPTLVRISVGYSF